MPAFVPDRALRDGDRLDLGRFSFTVLWCPGHAPGEVCLYDERAGLLIAGDHVLPGISPNVGIYAPEDADPLGDYLAALARVRDLPVGLVLPGHGEPFTGLAARVDAIATHHAARLTEIGGALGDEAITAYDLCARLRWAGGRARWADLPPFQHALALAETIAHLELLRRRGRARREEDGGTIRYAIADWRLRIAD